MEMSVEKTKKCTCKLKKNDLSSLVLNVIYVDVLEVMDMRLVVNLDEVVEELKAELREIVKIPADQRYGTYLTTKQTRQYLGGISTNTLNKLRQQGLPRVTIDGLCLYKKTDICEFLDGHKR
ncbi:helix-turn-helix domain-containing protein [Enterococcus gilvus]|nr:helix-turn-helix domain-containing protein [Enterococcus gilvus]